MRVAIIGCGTAGPAAAALLSEHGHDVEIFERAPELSPVGAGLLLQPTGLEVLERLGVASRVIARGSIIRSLLGTTRDDQPVLEAHYRDLRSDVFGLGVHRAMLLEVLTGAALSRGVRIRTNTEVLRVRDPSQPVVESARERFGPFDLCIIAAGARTLLRDHDAFGATSEEYPWGAVWVVVPDEQRRYGDTLRQVYDNAQAMVGFLPSGHPSAAGAERPTVSMFWSVRVREIGAWRARPIAAWKRAVAELSPLAAPILERVCSWDQALSATYHDVRTSTPHVGKIVVIGDAAHAMSPQLGQGANLALMDGSMLADCVGRGTDVPGALAEYASRRRSHVRFYQLASRWLTPVFQGDRESIGPARDMLMHRVLALPWVRRQMLLSLAGLKTGLLSARALPPRRERSW